MSRLFRVSFAFVLLLCGEAWAIGLGDIRLDSALNEPLRAEIDLLSATPEELAELEVALASSDTFERYGLDRPAFLQSVQFNVVGGRNVVQLRSTEAITEPFLTFIVEATWPRGRLLREYTVLLDPPTFAPPAAQQAPAVQAPSRAAPSDAGRIERRPAPAPQPAPAPAPRPAPVAEDRPYDTTTGGDVFVQRGDTLWGIAARARPDGRLSMNQMMMAIFEANPQAFEGNINRLRANVSLRIPSADEIYRISRGEAFEQVKRQNAAWSGAPAPEETQRPSLTLVPPDEEDIALPYDDEVDTAAEPMTREQEIEARIAEIEAAEVPVQRSLIEIRNNELAELRKELAEIRGEVYEPPVEEDVFLDEGVAEEVDEEMAADEEVIADTDQPFPDFEEAAVDEEAAAEDVAGDVEPEPVAPVSTQPEKGLVDRIIEGITGIYGIIAGIVIVVAAILFWFLRRGRGEDEAAGPWESLEDEEEIAAGALAATETMAAPKREDDTMIVVEQESAIRALDDTIDAPVQVEAPTEDTGAFDSLEDTFSSDTAVNLDQQDPLAEADFHMAYGLYDQAADLVNGALAAEPNDRNLLSKLCEIYFVWGNRDAFIDAAGRLKGAVGDGDSPDWDKVVIMGQQIAADDALFAGASAVGATKAVDLAFEADEEEAAALDMDFGADTADDEVIDLGADEAEEGVDFLFSDEAAVDSGAVDMTLEATAESPTVESPLESDITGELPAADETGEMPTAEITKTVEMPKPSSDTVETPTVEQQFAAAGGTSELPALDESTIDEPGPQPEATAEINLDDLGLDVADLDITAESALLDADLEEELADITGKNPEIDPSATGVHGDMRLATDETGAMPALVGEDEDTDVGIDESLLDATGLTQVIPEDMAVDTTGVRALSDEDATMLAGLDEDEPTAAISDDEATLMAPSFGGDADEEFDFAKTEALPPEAFSGDSALEDTSEIPAVAETDVDLDLDDLTAALQVSQAGDTIDMPRDDATVEQPRPNISETGPTVQLAPDEFSDDLDEARTMTEVGTKLDLARAYVDMGDPAGARSILEEVLDEGDEAQRQQAKQLLDSL